MRTTSKNRRKMYYFSENLRKQLAPIANYPLTLIEAPSGFGKTTAIREYLNRNISENDCQYWYTCLGEATSIAWAGICEMLTGINAEAAANLKKVELPTLDTLAGIMVALRGCQCTSETYLVVDNYHLVECDVPRELISVFSMHGCPRLHIIFITQQLTRKQLFTLHGDNIYCIDSSALLFDKGGTDKIFRMEGIRLSDYELEHVSASTEGWVVAIRLQIINYQENGTFNFTIGIEQLVETAIWDRLTGKEKDFLVAVSVLGSFSAQQAAMMAGLEALPGNIEDLLRSNDFIRYVPDQGIYIMHNILQAFLQNRFYYHQSQRFQSTVLRRAGASFAAAGEYCPAGVIFCKERDFDSLLAMPLTGEYITNLKEEHCADWIETMIKSCPQETLIKYPFKLLLYAYQMVLLKKHKTYRKLCRLISFIIRNQAGLSREELKTLRGEYVILRTCTVFSNLAKRVEGYKLAWKILSRPSIIITPKSPWPCGCSILHLFWCKSGKLEYVLRQLDGSSRFYRKLTGGHMRGADSLMRAEALLMQGKDEEAEILCYKALYDAQSYRQVGISLCADLILARIAILRGDTDGYFTAVRNIQLHTKDNSSLHLLRTAELCLTMLSLVLGNTENIPSWFCSMENIAKVLYSPAVSTARILYAQKLFLEKRFNEFYGFSKHSMEIGKEESFMMPKVYNLIFLAYAQQRGGRQREAQAHLQQALAIALPDKIYLPFAEQRGDFCRLLEAETCYGSDRPGLVELIAVCKRQEKGSNIIKKSILVHQSPLTPREREIAILAKDRLTAQEIADKLYIAPATVRTVLRNVYGKLDIHSKAELWDKKF